MDTLLNLENISLSFGARKIFQNLNVNILSGKLIGLLGPNGSGKTTLLKIMAGLLKPDHGEVHLQGKNLNHYSRKDLAQKIAVLPQENFMEFPFKAMEVVLMGRYPYLRAFQWENAQDLKIAREAMELTDSWQFAQQDICELSGGERERVLLARALAQQPKLLLLDEPTTHLDLKHQQHTYHLLKNLNREKKIAMVVVLHDLNFATQLCDQVWLLDTQGVLKAGGVDEVLTPEQIQNTFDVAVVAHKNAQGKTYLQRKWEE